jgi:hypothetical protein
MNPMSMFTEVGIFVGNNVQVTAAKAEEPRSESSIVADPRNPSRLLGASKHFTDPAKYHFTLGAVFSDDGGVTWKDLPAFPLQPHHDVYTDPSTAFDTKGHAWVMGDPGFFPSLHSQLNSTLGCSGTFDSGTINTTQMLAFNSSNNGQAWSSPVPIIAQRCAGDDKGWIACDNSTARARTRYGDWKLGGKPLSPWHGRFYAIWGALTPFRFARSDDGINWTGTKNHVAGADVCPNCYAPDISIGKNGWIHVFWHNPGTSTIQYVRSKDGGDTFEGQSSVGGVPTPWDVVTGLTDLSSNPPNTSDGWPALPGSTFRVLTIVSACSFGDKGLIVGWADTTETNSRTYYRVSYDDGDTWEGPDAGSPLLPQLADDSHQFHPQFAATGSGVVGCAMYSYAKDARPGNKPGVAVLMACSFDNAGTFDFEVVTDQPWDPALHAPISHGQGSATFIGDYFGLDASATQFHLLWTDTRTGTQDLFYCGVDTQRTHFPRVPDGIYGTPSAGVAEGAGGYIIVNGHKIPVPPHSPSYAILQVLAALQLVSAVTTGDTRAARAALLGLVGDFANKAGAQLHGVEGKTEK